MAPKKNKKGNKLARMSDEEKLRYLQHRAAVEEETRRRKEHLVATYLKVKCFFLLLELFYTNNCKINLHFHFVVFIQTYINRIN